MGFIVCGFMGSGKSTLLQVLKKDNNNANYYDLDDEILASYNEEGSLGDLIRKHGWEDFRKRESNTLSSILNDLGDNDVLALGGGALEELENQHLVLGASHYLVWLNVPFDICYSRITGDPNRPLLEMGKDKLKELFENRSEHYSICPKQLNLEELSDIDSYATFKEALSLD